MGDMYEVILTASCVILLQASKKSFHPYDMGERERSDETLSTLEKADEYLRTLQEVELDDVAQLQRKLSTCRQIIQSTTSFSNANTRGPRISSHGNVKWTMSWRGSSGFDSMNALQHDIFSLSGTDVDDKLYKEKYMIEVLQGQIEETLIVSKTQELLTF